MEPLKPCYIYLCMAAADRYQSRHLQNRMARQLDLGKFFRL